MHSFSNKVKEELHSRHSLCNWVSQLSIMAKHYPPNEEYPSMHYRQLENSSISKQFSII